MNTQPSAQHRGWSYAVDLAGEQLRWHISNAPDEHYSWNKEPTAEMIDSEFLWALDAVVDTATIWIMVSDHPDATNEQFAYFAELMTEVDGYLEHAVADVARWLCTHPK
jgi:hypothetical protein